MSVLRRPACRLMPTSMARRPTLDTLLTTRLSALTATLPAALAGDAGAVHQARVASRRLREVLPALEAAGVRAAARVVVKVRRVTRALGAARDCDVALGHLTELVTRHPVSPLALSAASRHVRRDRELALREARRVLTPARLRRLFASLESLKVPGHVESDDLARVVRARVQRRARDLGEALGRLGGVYVPGRLHRVRIAVKRLRYALEASAVSAAPSTQLRQLRAIQELLGRAHDLHVLAARLRHSQTRIVGRSRRAARELGNLADVLDTECRQLHAVFVTRKAALAALVEALRLVPTVAKVRSVA